MTRRELPQLTPLVVLLTAAGAAVLCGLVMAIQPAAGVGLTLALGFASIALLNLRTAIALWTPLVFLKALPLVSVAPTLASLIVLIAWVGTTGERRRASGDGIGIRPGLGVGLSLLLLWMTVTLGWTDGIPEGASILTSWFVGAGILVVVGTTLRSGRDVELVAGACVLGAVASVALGLVIGGFEPAASATETAGASEGRLTGGSGDPNYLAAALVPALVLTGGLAAATRSPLVRLALLPAAAVIAIGVGATQSRGGFIAALVAALAALVVLRHHRRHVLLGLVTLGTLAALQFASAPGAFDRVAADGGGTGRTELWTVALRVAESHPVVGAGLGDFENEARFFVREPGGLEFVSLIAERPHVVHNSYLQLLTEVGAIGLVLYLVVILAGLATTYRAAGLLAAADQEPLATLARAVFVAQLSLLAALFFVSKGSDPLLWLLFGLGVALDRIARPLGAASKPAHGAAAPRAVLGPQ